VNITREDLPDRQVALTIELETAEVEPALQKAYRQLVGRVNIPGFRPGKAPRHVFERFVGREALIEQAVEGMLTTTLPAAIEEQGIDSTDISDVRIESTDPVTIRVVVDQPAKVELGEYDDIRVAREPVDITPDKVEEVLTSLRRREGTWAAPAEPRPARVGDRVVVDMETYTIDGPVKNMTGESLSMELTATAPPTWPVEIDENIVGLSPGEEKDFAITFPEGYPDEDMRGKDATVHVKLQSLEELTVPDLDEAFTQKAAGVETVEELRQRIDESLRREAEENTERTQVDAVIQQMVDRSTVEVPSALIEREIDRSFERLGQRLKERHIDPKRYFTLTGTSEEEWRAAQREPARERLRQTLVLGEFARRAGVDVSDADVEQAIDERMQPFAGTPTEDRIREIFASHEQRHQIENQLFERRLMDRLVALAEGRLDELAATPDTADTDADAATEPDDATVADLTASSDDATATGDSDGEATSDGPPAPTTDVAASSPTPTISGAIPATEQEPGPLEAAGGAAEVLGADETLAARSESPATE
jgi:trigger factor